MSPASDSFTLNYDQLPAANLIDEVCDRFEAAWRSGARPTIRDFLDETAEPHGPRLFAELVRIDIEYRVKSGDPASIEEYESQYPEYSDILTGLRREPQYAETIPLNPAARRRLGRYELHRELGQGGFGAVWKAWDGQLKRWVAVKLPRERLDGYDHQKAFLREARAAAELEHPHIVPVIDSGVKEGTVFIVSRFVEGISLRQWMRARPLTPREVAGLCASLAEAVDYARTKGVVHRDLKPSNVLIDAHGQPHITDFGLASRHIDGVTIEPSGPIAGTPAYMSPEQVRGTSKPDHRSDVYSLGVTLYELLTGRLPFLGDQPAVLHQVLHVEPSPLRTKNSPLPADLETICLKTMAKEPERRYQTAGELAEDLRRFLHGEPIRARRAGRVEKVWRCTRRNPALSAAILIAFLTSSAAIAFYSHRPQLTIADEESRLVTLKTEPPGARIVFYQLNEQTGEPDPQRRIEAPERSPVKLKLPAGNYFVVAALDPHRDGTIRFHEVFRHIPRRDETIAKGGGEFWEIDDDDPSAIMARSILIPAADITAGMAFIEGTDQFRMGRVNSTIVPSHIRGIRDFYMDPTEVSIAQRAVVRHAADPFPQRAEAGCAAVVPYDEATWVAEKLGKRLPTEAEYEYAATNRGQTEFAWGDMPPSAGDIETDRFEDVSIPTFDRLPTMPPVFGLCSNVAEWTTTYACLYPSIKSIPPIPASRAGQERVVRGPFNPHGIPPTGRKVAEYNPRARHLVNRYVRNEGLGLRCVRSAKPHLSSSDFPKPSR